MLTRYVDGRLKINGSVINKR